jgi:hypothetical protein
MLSDLIVPPITRSQRWPYFHARSFFMSKTPIAGQVISGHLPFYEEPDAFVRTVEDFLGGR